MRTAFIAAAAGLASAPLAHAQAQPRPALPADIAGHIYYNMSTGEIVRSGGAPATRDASSPVWVNETYDQCGFGEWFYFEIRDSAAANDLFWLDWGDVESNSVVDCITFFYFTTVSVGVNGEDGFELDLSFFDGIDIPQIEDGVDPFLVYTLAGIPGANSGGGAAWLITVDVSGGGEFEIGDADGIDDAGNGLHSGGQGVDADGDGLSDFAYGIAFRHPNGLASGYSGPRSEAPPPRPRPAMSTSPPSSTPTGMSSSSSSTSAATTAPNPDSTGRPGPRPTSDSTAPASTTPVHKTPMTTAPSTSSTSRPGSTGTQPKTPAPT